MVTRTVVGTKATCLLCNKATNEVKVEDIIVASTYPTVDKLKKAVSLALGENSDWVVAHIKATENVETLYGMLEQDFINNAKILDPETRKVLEAEGSIEA